MSLVFKSLSQMYQVATRRRDGDKRDKKETNATGPGQMTSHSICTLLAFPQWDEPRLSGKCQNICAEPESTLLQSLLTGDGMPQHHNGFDWIIKEAQVQRLCSTTVLMTLHAFHSGPRYLLLARQLPMFLSKKMETLRDVKYWLSSQTWSQASYRTEIM